MSVSSWSWTITAIALGLSYLGTEWEYGALPPPPNSASMETLYLGGTTDDLGDGEW